MMAQTMEYSFVDVNDVVIDRDHPAGRGLTEKELSSYRQSLRAQNYEQATKIKWSRVTPLQRESWESQLPVVAPQVEVSPPPPVVSHGDKRKRSPPVAAQLRKLGYQKGSIFDQWILIAGIRVPAWRHQELARRMGEPTRKWRQRLRAARNAQRSAKQAFKDQQDPFMGFKAEEVKFSPMLTGSFKAAEKKMLEAEQPAYQPKGLIKVLTNKQRSMTPLQRSAWLNRLAEKKMQAQQRALRAEIALMMKSSVALAGRRKIQTELYSVDKFSHVLTYFAKVACLNRPATKSSRAATAAYLNRSAAVFNSIKNIKNKIIFGQMDNEQAAHGINAEGSVAQESNVILATEREPSTAEASISSANAFINMAAQNSDLASETWTRPLFVEGFDWSTSSVGNLYSFDFLNDLFKLEHIRNSPNMMMFYQHSFFSSDLEIKLELNSNVRQYGQLQAAFYYSANCDNNFSLRKNIYTCSQMPHALLNASGSNEAILNVPFEYINPFICTFSRDKNKKVSKNNVCHIGTLLINVIAPLTVASTTSNSCRVSMYFSFKNARYAGLIDRRFVFGNMFSMVKELGKRVLNLDQPTVNQVGNYVIPQNTTSWCAGTGIANALTSLRLNPNCVLNYPPGRLPTGVDMTVDSIKRVFGLLTVFDWTAQDQYGKQLWTMPAEPITLDKYYGKVTKNQQDLYVYPPVSVLSSLSSYWKGSLEFRFDIIGPTEISGRLQICYIPNVCDDEIDITAGANCMLASCDIQENRQIIFTVPYLSDTVMRRRHFDFSTTNDAEIINVSPGSLYIHVLNPLIVNSTIPNNCKIAVYLRGGPDFEIAVPAAPILGLGFNTDILYPPGTDTLTVYPKDGYWPVYSGSWRFFTNTAGHYACIYRYGPVTDHIAQFAVNDDYSKVSGKKLKAKDPSALIYFNGGNTTKYVFTIRMLQWWPTGDYIYLIVPKAGREDQVAALCKQDEAKTLTNYALLADECEQYTMDGWNVLPHRIELVTESGVEGNAGDERQNIEAPPYHPIQSAASSVQSILGESFRDLKDFCRRPQLYAKGQIDVAPDVDSIGNLVDITFPVVPQGLNLDLGSPNNINEVFNRYRDGPIPLIASGYRFFSGGIRFRIVITPSNGTQSGARYLVTHHPTTIIPDLAVQVTNYGHITSENFESPGTASHLQMHSTNPIIHIEVPWYKEYVRSWLQRPESTFECLQASTLGNINVSITVMNSETRYFKYEIYYELADDAYFTVFTGFPPMMRITNIQSRKIKKPSNPTPDAPIINVDEINRRLRNVEVDMVVAKGDISNNKDLSQRNKFDVSSTTNRVVSLEYKVKDFVQMSLFNSYANKLNKFKDDTPAFLMKSVSPTLSLYTGAELNKASEDRRNVRIAATIAPRISRSDVSIIRAIEEAVHEEVPEGNMMETFYDVKEAASKLKKINVNKINETVEVASDAILETKTEIDLLIGMVHNAMDQVKTKLNNFSVQTEMSKGIIDTLANSQTMIVNCISQLLHCCISQDTKTIALAVITIFFNLGMITWKSIGNLACILGKFFQNCVNPPNEQNGGGRVQGNALGPDDNSNIKLEYISMFISSVASMFKLKCNWSKEEAKPFGELLFAGLSDFALTSNKMLSFVKNHIAALTQIFNFIFRFQPGMKEVAYFKDFNTEIYDWAVSVTEITDARNEMRILTDVHKATEVYDLANQGLIVRLKILEIPNFPPNKLNIINNLVTAITKLRDRLARMYVCPPIRYEPFTVYCSGESRIGKTNALQELCCDLLHSIGYKTFGEPMFVRTPGNAYWNTLTNQPICFYDDFYISNAPDFGDVQLAELINLKSRILFNPPKAAVEDKEIRYNPLILGICSNKAFHDMPSVTHANAIYNRRDVLLLARRRHVNQINDNVPVNQIPLDILKDFGQIEFKFVPDVLDKDSEARLMQDNTGWLSYQETKAHLVDQFQRYHERETAIYSHLVKKLSKFLPDHDNQVWKWPKHIDWDSFNEQHTRYLEADRAVHQALQEQNYSYYHRCKQALESFNTSLIVQTSQKLGTKLTELKDLFKSKNIFGNMNDDDEGKTKGSCSEPIPVKVEEIAIHQIKVTQESVLALISSNCVDPNERDVSALDFIAQPNSEESEWKTPSSSLENLETTDEILKADHGSFVPYLYMSNDNPREDKIYLRFIENKQFYKDWTSEPFLSMSMEQKAESFFCAHYKLAYMMLQDCSPVFYVPNIDDSIELERKGKGKWHYRINLLDIKTKTPFRFAHDGFIYEQETNTIVIPEEPCNYCKANKELPSFLAECYYIEQREELESFGKSMEAFLPLALVKLPGYTHRLKIIEFLKPNSDDPEIDDDSYPEIPTHDPETPFWTKIKNFFKFKMPSSKFIKDIYKDCANKYVGFYYWAFNQDDMSPKGHAQAFLKKTLAFYTIILQIDILMMCAVKIGSFLGSFFSRQDPPNIPPPDVPPTNGNGFTSGDFKTGGKPKDRRNLNRKILGKSSKNNDNNSPASGQMSDQEFASITELIYNNTCFIVAYNDVNDSKIAGRCLGLTGNDMLIVDHYWEAWNNFKIKYPSCFFYLVYARHQIPIDITLEELTYRKYNDSSLGILTLPKRMPYFKRIIKHICPEHRHSSINGIGKIIEITADIDNLRAKENIWNVVYRPSPKLTAKGSELYKDFETSDLYEYADFGGLGTCGSVLLSTNFSAPIIGMHVAGLPGGERGYAEVISSEDFADLLATLDRDNLTLGNMENCALTLNTQVIGLGRVTSKFRHRENENSRIKPSYIQKFNDPKYNLDFPIFSDVSVLSPKDERIKDNPFSPMLEGCEYHGEPLKEIPEEFLKLAIEDTLDVIKTTVKPVRPIIGKLTKLEACAGIPWLKNYDPLEWRTSEGFPFVAFRPGSAHDKRWLFKFNEEGICVGLDDKLISEMKRNKAKRMQGIIPNTIFTDCLKDCTVAKEKVLTPGKTRVFSMAPIQFTIQQRQYTLDFVAAYMENRIKAGHAIGINPDSPEWKDVLCYLGEVSLDNIISADFSKFGDKLPYRFILAAVYIIEQWYKFNLKEPMKESMKKFFETMPHEIGHAIHLMFDFVYQVLCGQPSGNSITVILNSLSGDLFTRCAWLEIMKNTRWASLYYYHKFVRQLTYGDDQIISVDDEVKEFFNGAALQAYYADLGIKFTTAQKTEGVIGFTSIWEANFLKRGFAPHPYKKRQLLGMILAPLEPQSIEDTLNWVWDSGLGTLTMNNPLYIEQSKEVCRAAALNAYSRGKEYYKQLTDKIKRFWQIHNEPIQLLSWDDIDNRVFDFNEIIHSFLLRPSKAEVQINQQFKPK